MLGHFSHVQLFAAPWTGARQAPLCMRFLQARILVWVAMPSSKGSSRPRDRTCDSYICFLHRQAGSVPLAPPGKPQSRAYRGTDAQTTDAQTTDAQTTEEEDRKEGVRTSIDEQPLKASLGD